MVFVSKRSQVFERMLQCEPQKIIDNHHDGFFHNSFCFLNITRDQKAKTIMKETIVVMRYTVYQQKFYGLSGFDVLMNLFSLEGYTVYLYRIVSDKQSGTVSKMMFYFDNLCKY